MVLTISTSNSIHDDDFVGNKRDMPSADDDNDKGAARRPFTKGGGSKGGKGGKGGGKGKGRGGGKGGGGRGGGKKGGGKSFGRRD